MNLAQGAKILDLDSTRFSRIESGSYRCSPENVEKLLKAYGHDDPETMDALRDASDRGLERGWWDAYEGVVHPRLKDFIALEAEAVRIRGHHGVLIPGLLQVPEYARDLMAKKAKDNAQAFEASIAVRQGRKAVLTRVDAPNVHLIFPEVALVREFGSQAVLRNQVRHLIDLCELPNLTISMMPLRTPNRPPLSENFSLMDFSHPWPVTAYSEHDRGGDFLDDPQDVAYMEKNFEDLTEVALDRQQTIDHLQKHLEG